MRFPSFLVIGAMKAGTTSLYEDLKAQPGIFLPEKELASLNAADVATTAGRTRYAKLFASAGDEQLRGEVSATYAKLPDSSGVVDRASQLLGDDFRVVYLVRDPIDRVVSHHHHEVSRGGTENSIDVAVKQRPHLLDYTRYATQLRPWVDLLGASRVRVVQFEEYVNDRSRVLNEICRFLGIGFAAGGSHSELIHNASAGRPIATGRMGHVVRSSAYQRFVRPLVPESARQLGGRLFLPKAPPRPHPPAPETVELIIQEIGPEMDRLSEITDRAWWDLESTKLRYQESYEQAQASPVADPHGNKS